MDKMQEALGVEHLDGMYSAKGSHNSLMLDPKPYNQLMNYALNAMENKDLTNAKDNTAGNLS